MHTIEVQKDLRAWEAVVEKGLVRLYDHRGMTSDAKGCAEFRSLGCATSALWNMRSYTPIPATRFLTLLLPLALKWSTGRQPITVHMGT